MQLPIPSTCSPAVGWLATCDVNSYCRQSGLCFATEQAATVQARAARYNQQNYHVTVEL